jgi:hypothetical protein
MAETSNQGRCFEKMCLAAGPGNARACAAKLSRLAGGVQIDRLR